MTSRLPVLYAATALLGFASTLAGCAGSSVPVSEAMENGHGVLLLDLVERGRSAAVRLSHAGEHFEEAAGTQIAGWSAPQRVVETGLSFAWATDRRATVRLDVRDPESRWLHLRCQAVPSDTGATQSVTVTVDGVEAGRRRSVRKTFRGPLVRPARGIRIERGRRHLARLRPPGSPRRLHASRPRPCGVGRRSTGGRGCLRLRRGYRSERTAGVLADAPTSGRVRSPRRTDWPNLRARR